MSRKCFGCHDFGDLPTGARTSASSGNRVLGLRFLRGGSPNSAIHCRTHIAPWAERALAHLDRATTDLILLDVSLPGLSGDELCRRLKSRPSTSGIPVAMFTARAEESTRQRAEAAGCDRYLVKPVMLSDLLTTLRELLTK